MNNRRVVVTGLGVISPLGNTVADTWTNALAGKSGIDCLTGINDIDGNVRVAGIVKDFDAVARFGAREARRLDKASQFGMAAAEQALTDSGLQITEENMYDVGCLIGTCVGGIESMVDATVDFEERGQRGVSPLAIPRILVDSPSGRVSMMHNLRGPNYAIVSACATGNNSIGEAADMIRLRRVKAMLAGSSEATLIPMVLAGFDNMKALAHYTGGDPTLISRPFDSERSGFVAGEGAAILMLEDLDYALERGARIYAEISGYGHTSDAYHITAPREDGVAAAEAMKRALKDAELKVEDIDYVNAHGTSTQLNDKSETTAIKLALGDHAYKIPISSTKSMTGHMLGAAGAIEALFSILAIRDGQIPPTINLDNPDPDCDLDYTPNVARKHAVKHAMSNSFGFGGHNTVLIVSEYEKA
ncbi:MAG: beta-ketoacyl-ACP synthase II [Chloroflexi bacterium]|nr:beta-ketoacyl-ACP synthase II [Chloroflexota bacterium]MCC6896760.1 beta-ketoacyl-ACP synthase II [Anaerolineae bacterium]